MKCWNYLWKLFKMIFAEKYYFIIFLLAMKIKINQIFIFLHLSKKRNGHSNEWFLDIILRVWIIFCYFFLFIFLYNLYLHSQIWCVVFDTLRVSHKNCIKFINFDTPVYHHPVKLNHQKLIIHDWKCVIFDTLFRFI